MIAVLIWITFATVLAMCLTGSSFRNDPFGELSHLTGYEQTYRNR